MSSVGSDLIVDRIKVNDIINWTNAEFVPPIQGGGVDTLAGVLAAGNSANNQKMINVGGLSLTPNSLLSPPDGHITGAEEVVCQNLRATFSFVTSANCIDLDFDENAGNTTISGSTVPGQETICTNLDLRDASNLFPSSIDDDTLGDVMARGNVAYAPLLMDGNLINMSGADITNVHNFDFSESAGQTNIYGDVTVGRETQCYNLDLTDASNIFPSGINGDLAATLALGNSAGSNNIDMNNQSVTNALLLGATNAQIGTPTTPGICAVVGTFTANTMQGRKVYLNNSATDPSALLEFTGLAGQGQTTEIIGDSSQTNAAANLTKCTFLDLTDGTNALPASESERYEWGATWTDAKTIFPPPPYADGFAAQIPTINQVLFDFNTIDTGRTPGWRYFAPQSDSDCQIDPDDHMGLHEGEYIHTNVSADAWKYAFYADTAATTVAAHSSQIVEFTFPVTYWGYGRIYIGVVFHQLPLANPPAAPQFMNQSFRLLMEHEGSALSNNERLNGPTTMRWFFDDQFPTNGTQYRLYPVIRVDDNEHYGRMKVVIGDGQPLYGCNPGDPPDFQDPPPTGQGQEAQNGQLFMRGYPLPATYNKYANPSETTSRYFDPPVSEGDPAW